MPTTTAAAIDVLQLHPSDNVCIATRALPAKAEVSAGMYTHIDGPHARVPVGHLKIGLIAAERKPHVTNDVIGDPRVPEQEWAMNNGLIAFAGYPLVCDGQLLGVMAMFSRHQLGDFVTRSLASIADSIALGIREKYDQERIERHVGQLTTLRKIDQAIISSLDLNFVLDQITAEAQVQLQADAVHVLLFDQKSKRLASAVGRGFRTNEYRRAQPRLDDSIAGEIVLEQRAATVSAESGGDTELRKMQWFQKESFSTYYGLPLISKGQVKGVLELFHRKPFPHSVEWIRFAEAIARLAAIGIDNAILFNETQRTTAELQLAYDTTLDGWSAALDLRDKETEGHTKRVTELSVELARKMGFSEEELVHLRRGALLHDIGKMGVPDHILLKPAPLTEEEWVIMKMHPVYAHSLLSPIRYLAQSLDIPYCHHEKWDGTGYPRGLKGEQIPLSARIFTVADIWDAIRSDRPYRAAWSKEKALEHIKSLSGTHLDAQVVKVFLEFQAQTRF